MEEALQLERDREAALRGQLEERATELEGPAVDEQAFAIMNPQDVDVVRHTLIDTDDDFGHRTEGEGDDQSWLEEFMESNSPEIDREEALSEVARLDGEIGDSRRRQAALERYLDALGAS